MIFGFFGVLVFVMEDGCICVLLFVLGNWQIEVGENCIIGMKFNGIVDMLSNVVCLQGLLQVLIGVKCIIVD